VKDSVPNGTAEVKAAKHSFDKTPTAAVEQAHEPAENDTRISTDGGAAAADHKRASQDASYNCHSMQSVKGDAPEAISIKVAPAPPPEEYPEIRAAVTAAQKEVKAGAKLKFASLYSLGKVIGTGHYAR
jgi:hypothetical protein